MGENKIVGWMVYDFNDIEHCAMYSLAEKKEAFDAAKRWRCPLVALSVHPDAPEIELRGVSFSAEGL